MSKTSDKKSKEELIKLIPKEVKGSLPDGKLEAMSTRELEILWESTKKKIISITMTNQVVDQLDELVGEGRSGRSRAQIIEDAVRWYLNFTVNGWTERGIFLQEFRFALESESMASLFFSQLTPTEQYELGVTAGSQAPVSDIITLYYDSDIRDHRGKVDRDRKENRSLGLLQDHGWGSIRKQGNLIIISNPFYPSPFIRGYLESYLNTKLELVETKGQENIALRIME